jgi:hypothetical protein
MKKVVHTTEERFDKGGDWSQGPEAKNELKIAGTE